MSSASQVDSLPTEPSGKLWLLWFLCSLGIGYSSICLSVCLENLLSIELVGGRKGPTRQQRLQELEGWGLFLMDLGGRALSVRRVWLQKALLTVSLNSDNHVVKIGTFISGSPVRKLKFLQ